jgi:hypothetical protein
MKLPIFAYISYCYYKTIRDYKNILNENYTHYKNCNNNCIDNDFVDLLIFNMIIHVPRQIILAPIKIKNAIHNKLTNKDTTLE